MVPPKDQVTADRYDLQFGTNVLGHYCFNKLLLPLLEATVKRDGIPTRLIVTSSSAQQFADTKKPINFDTLIDGPNRRKLSSNELYNQSKFANVVYAKEMAKRYGNQGVITISLNPGTFFSLLGTYFLG
jgi:retinol dehydrogenase-12